MTYPVIGSKYIGPAFDRPSLRRLPPGWYLEESKCDHRKAQWYQIRKWLRVAFMLTVLLGYVAAVKAVLS